MGKFPIKLWLILELLVCRYIQWSCAYPFQDPPHIDQLTGEDDEDEYFESGEEELINIRNLISTRLGITNFSRPALLEVALKGAVDYLVSVAPTDTPTSIRNQSFIEISLPDLVTLTNGTGLNSTNGIIEISLPPELRQSLEAVGVDATVPPSINQKQMMNNIETAIMGAIMEAQQTTPRSATSGSSVAPGSGKSKRPARVRPTTLSPIDKFVADSFNVFIQEGQKEVSQFFWKNLLRIGSQQTQSVLDDVIGCQIFYNCDNENELGPIRRRPS